MIAAQLLAIGAVALALGIAIGRWLERNSAVAPREPALTVHQARGCIEPPHDPAQRVPFRTIRGGKSC